MRNLFSFNIEASSEISEVSKYAKPFVLREANEAIVENQKKIAKKMDELEAKWSLPTWLGYTKVISTNVFKRRTGQTPSAYRHTTRK